MTRLSAGTETSVGSDGVGAGLEFGVGTGVGVGDGCFGVGEGFGGGVTDGVEAGSVEHANITVTTAKYAKSTASIRMSFIAYMRYRQRLHAASQSRKLFPVRFRKTSSRVVVFASPTCDFRPRGVSSAISLPLSMMPIRSQRRSASSM